MNTKKQTVLFVLIFFIVNQSFAQLSSTISAEGGMLIGARFDRIAIFDKHALYKPHKRHGMYSSLGFELQQYNYEILGLRHRLNFDLAAESIYILLLMAIKNDWKDPDGRFRTSSYFNTGIFEYVPQVPVYTNNTFCVGIGGALYDLNYTHYLYDENGQPDNPQKSDVSQYGFYGGWSLFVDAMIQESLTLHTDFYYGYSFYNGSQNKLSKIGEPSQPFNSWKITSKLLYKNGMFFSARYHQVVNKTSILTSASRLSLGIGYRFGMN